MTGVYAQLRLNGEPRPRISREVELIGLQSPAGDPIFPHNRRIMSRFRVPRVAHLKRKCPCRGGLRETRPGTIVVAFGCRRHDPVTRSTPRWPKLSRSMKSAVVVARKVGGK
jgi:hypothetical protein